MSEHHCIAQEFLRVVHCLCLGWEKLGRAASRTINRGDATGKGGGGVTGDSKLLPPLRCEEIN